MRRVHIVLLLALCAAITACGNKGPLVLPDQKPATPDKSTTGDSGKQP
jgi:predicted small lipoprotein YifL